MLTTKKETECLCFMNVEIGGGPGTLLSLADHGFRHKIALFKCVTSSLMIMHGQTPEIYVRSWRTKTDPGLGLSFIDASLSLGQLIRAIPLDPSSAGVCA
jgi:hypothetical protein